MQARTRLSIVALVATPMGILVAGSLATDSAAPPPAAIGSDVAITELTDLWRWGAVGDVTAFNVGTEICNVGDEIIPWQASTSHHPAISNNMYRLMDGRFEQIGLSWVKHGYLSTNSPGCGNCQDPGSGALLGIGCSDVYAAILNGDQSRLGPRADINSFTGVFPFPPTRDSGRGRLDGRMQLHAADLDPALNAGARYFVEGRYIVPEDAQDGNGANNASHREVRVTGSSSFNLQFNGATQAQRPAIFAWRDADPSVQIHEVLVPGEGAFVLAHKVSDNGDGTWDYEYALYNHDSDRAANGFAVPLPNGTTLGQAGFHDIDYHSGEPQDGTDWGFAQRRGHAVWRTAGFAQNPNANALRWGTLYNFRFTADRAPGPAVLTIGLFKPGTPKVVTVAAVGPQ